MRVLIFEDNLMWSSRLAKSVGALGHEPVLLKSFHEEAGDMAIVNLASQSIPADKLVPQLKERGISIIAHAGHKEKELMALGKELGCDRLATNSELTFKIGDLLRQAQEELERRI